MPTARFTTTIHRRSTIKFEQAVPGTDPRYHFAINVPPASIDDAAAWVEERHELLAFHDDPEDRKSVV